MELVLEALTYHRHSDQPLSVLVILVVRVTLVLLTGCLIGRWCAKRSAAWEHQVWLLTLLTTLLVPLVWAVTPAWRMPLVALEVSDNAMRTVRALQAGETLANRDSLALADWPQVLLAVWILGASLALAHALWSVGCAIWLVRRSRPCSCPAWHALLADVRRALAITRPVELRWVPCGSSPAVWGWRRVQVLVPEGSHLWPATERKHVLIHELAHAARHDCWWRLVASLVCAVWWFHPLVWVAAARLRTAGERAADDCVVRMGGDVTDYAQHLLSIAMRLSGVPMTAATPTMMRPSQLEVRLRALLLADRDRAPLGRRGQALTCLVAALLTWALATWTPSVVRAQIAPAAPTTPPNTQGSVTPGSVTPKPARPRTLIIVRPSSAPPTGTNQDTLRDPILLRSADVPSSQVPADSVQRLLRLVAPPASDQTDGRMVVVPVPPEGLQPFGQSALPVPASPPPAKMQLIPNWEAGRKADAKLPNYQPGTAKIQLLEPRPKPTTTVTLETLESAVAAPGAANLIPPASGYPRLGPAVAPAVRP